MKRSVLLVVIAFMMAVVEVSCATTTAPAATGNNTMEVSPTTPNDAPSTSMTVGGRAYYILGFLHGDENGVRGTVVVDRAKEMNANLGQDDGQHLLDHQDEIPVALRGKVAFFFTDWRHADDSERVAYVYWRRGDRRWVQYWDLLAHVWDGHHGFVLRRK